MENSEILVNRLYFTFFHSYQYFIDFSFSIWVYLLLLFSIFFLLTINQLVSVQIFSLYQYAFDTSSFLCFFFLLKILGKPLITIHTSYDYAFNLEGLAFRATESQILSIFYIINTIFKRTQYSKILTYHVKSNGSNIMSW